MANQLPSTVSFEDQALTIIERDGYPHLPARDLARALGYADTSAVTRIYARHREEFTDDMAPTVNLTVGSNQQEIVRIFSTRGCHLIAMFARTDRAAAFRRWVLNVLESLAVPQAPVPAALPPVDILPPINGMITEPAKGLLAGHLLAIINRFGAMPQAMEELERYGQLPIPRDTQAQLNTLRYQTRLIARESARLATVADTLARNSLGLRQTLLTAASGKAMAEQAIAEIHRLLDDDNPKRE
jgi:hypothetical protein